MMGGCAAPGPGPDLGPWGELLQFETPEGVRIAYYPGAGALWIGEERISKSDLPELRALLRRIERAFGD